ncbi:hypothetical protein Tco_0923998 [Tanacetum coccineum]|uniref:Uncharacterized protein n=1 Tax=Tanacetum coccineum TaxID=301880 RepID=A0ABQ5D9M8_9ASTR
MKTVNSCCLCLKLAVCALLSLAVCVSTQILRFVLEFVQNFLRFVHKIFLAVCANFLRFVHNTNLVVCVTDLAVCAFLLILAVCANFLPFVHNINLAVCVTDLAVCITTLAGETLSSQSVKESSLVYETSDVHAIQNKMPKAKERCMSYFRSLHSHLQVLSNEDLKGTRTEHGFKRAFISLFGQDVETFTSMMFLYVDQLEKQLEKDEFPKDDSMDAFWALNRHCQQFIYSQFSLDYDNQMTNKSLSEYTRIKAKDFRDTLLKQMSSVKKSIAERARHQT